MVAPELHPWKLDGVSGVVRGLSNALASFADVELTVLATVPSGTDPYRFGYSKQIKFMLVEQPRWPEPFYHMHLQLGYLKNFLAWSGSAPSGFVHFEILPAARAGLAALACVLRGHPRLVTLHGWNPFEIPTERNFWRKMGQRGHWMLARLLLPFFPYMVVNSKYIGAEVSNKLRPQRLYIIPNGFDANLWSADNQRPSSTPMGFAYWGRMWERKGVWPLVRAFEIFAKRYTGDLAHLYMIGAGPEASALQKWVRERRLEEQVVFLGSRPAEWIREFVKSVPIAVFPGLHDSFSLSIVEAMAAGMAVITSNMGGQTDFIKHKLNGWVVTSLAPESLASALYDVANDGELRNRLGLEAQRTAQQFQWPKIAPQYREIYRRLLSKVN
jgi:glycosyltransferase involved in cell wall biosynthesis